MPIYEYLCERDGTRLELLRPMSQADAPVEDPEGKGRVFTRVHSTFAAAGTREGSGGASGGASGGGASGGKHVHVGGCCPCGKPGGGCGGRS